MSFPVSQPVQAHDKAISPPEPRTPVSVRPATMDDLPFIDALQWKHTKMLGWMPRAQLEGKIRAGHVLVAEGRGSPVVPLAACPPVRAAVDPDTGGQAASGTAGEIRPLGFVMGCDQYFKRDDCGIIYQLCVAEGQRRGLIGAALVRALFDRAAYGCRLYSCWCAQDI